MAEDTLEVVPRIADIPAEQWDSCAGADNPFVRHAFLDALERSGSATPETGWAPRHLVARDALGKVAACAPLYLKSHSYGEYVFDWGWAEAYHRAGGRYYPKLQCCVPFTPVGGPRLLVREGGDRAALERLLLSGMIELARRHEASSLHVTFPTQAEHDRLTGLGLLGRIGQQYHWRNRGYGRFEDFLADLSSRKRKAIRKERERANAQGLDIVTLSGSDLREEHWDAFHRFYIDTTGRKWGRSAYLTRDFFLRLGETMPDSVVLVMAREGRRWVAGALNLLGGDTLYGRNWGALGEWPFLHFEMCYYRAIDEAIARRLTWVEAGAQGEHKIQRGYLPRPTFSAHWIADDSFRGAVARFLDHEREAVREDIEDLAEAGPFRHPQ
ncbi:MAG: N-acetyltransferase [Alphaproteobacteria bacterium]|nr:N-acetyltransferase [Alphaproteobacteria bacterium]